MVSSDIFWVDKVQNCPSNLLQEQNFNSIFCHFNTKSVQFQRLLSILSLHLPEMSVFIKFEKICILLNSKRTKRAFTCLWSYFTFSRALFSIPALCVLNTVISRIFHKFGSSAPISKFFAFLKTA